MMEWSGMDTPIRGFAFKTLKDKAVLAIMTDLGSRFLEHFLGNADL